MYTHVSVCMYIRALTHASAATRSHQRAVTHAHMPGPDRMTSAARMPRAALAVWRHMYVCVCVCVCVCVYV